MPERNLCTFLQRNISKTAEHEVRVIYRTDSGPFACCANALLSLLTPPHIPRDESSASCGRPISSSTVHALRLGFADWIMTTTTPIPRRRSPNKVSQTYYCIHARPHASNGGIQILSRKTKERAKLGAYSGDRTRSYPALTVSIVRSNPRGAVVYPRVFANVNICVAAEYDLEK